MIKGHSIHSTVATEVVLVRRVVPVPGDNIEWGVVDLGFIDLAQIFIDNLEFDSNYAHRTYTYNVGLVDSFIVGNWCLEVSWISQTISTDRTKVWNPEMALEDLADPASGLFADIDTEPDSSWYHADLELLDRYLAEFCGDI